MIGGNVTAVLQVRDITTNKIGEAVETWFDVKIIDTDGEEKELKGFIDLQSGDSNRTSFNAKIEESTHMFLCDYLPIPDSLEVDGKVLKVNEETTRMVVNSKNYDVKLIDDPMGLHKHLEIYLNYTGGQ